MRDPFRFHPINQSVYESIGSGPLPSLILSWMVGGQVYSDTRTVKTTQGNLTLQKSQTWGSRLSMMEDIHAATGQSPTYARVRYATQKLVKMGYLKDNGLAFPKTRGRFGKIYEVGNVSGSGSQVDTVRTAIMYYYGDVSEFTHGEIITADNMARRENIKRNRFGNQQRWAEFIAKGDFPREAHTTIGRWQSGKVREELEPVLVPWITIDIDRPHILDAWNDTKRIVGECADRGYDLNRILVSFSGRRGFHIQIASSQFGSPIFIDAIAATETVRSLVSDLTEDWDIETDPSVYSPLSSIRLSGSLHGETKMRKVTVLASEIPPIDDLLEMATRTGHQNVLIDPIIGEIEEGILQDFRDAVNDAGLRRLKLMRQYKSGGKMPETISLLIKGVAESEVWHPQHCGRDKAAFVYGCHLIEKYGIDIAWSKLQDWNGLNDPPLLFHELQRPFKSAKRKVNG